ncbi:S8 family serine peptidase [Allorhizocola rhizosphaerae]|uniref:S8 family serine peptidase n=1 Tax=Allorhizocola rhizosphaerae TaxID=1872709 RepID=UPI000E3BE3A7|nr:S8 family serine peptidase [Allorhizocola rhizosphaerae]
MNKRSLAACVTVVLGAAGLISDTSVAAPPGPQRRVIVLFEDNAVTTAMAGKRLGLINGVAMTASDSEIKQLKGVRAVWPDAPVKAHVDVSTSLIGATEVREKHNATGRGVRVAVIDTGVDYTHPDLAGRVVKGYDFANGDADPMDDHGHGTHVAGIIAGMAAAPGGVTGVAPEATIVAYKVLNDRGSGYTSDIVAAIEAAASGQADVINLSLGGPGDGSDPMSLAAKAASQRGVVVVAAAGNAGPYRDSVSSPAVADSVIAVGASTSNLRMPSAYLGNGLLQTWRGAHSANPPGSPVTAEVVHVPDWATAPDVRGKIVRFETFVPRVKQDLTSWDIELAREAETRGAIALLGGFPGTVQNGPSIKADAGVRVKASGDLLVMDRLVVLGMDQTQYDEMTRLLAAGPVRVTIKGEDVTDQIAPFSSRGPSPSFGLKPDLVAPGVEIRSTIPTALFEPGQYRLSGTSMAAPHVAGAAALLRQLNPGQSPAEIHSRLVNSSKSLSGTEVGSRGAGRLDVAGAANATLTASPPVLSFGLADLSTRDVGASRRLTVRNTGSRAVLARLGTGSRDVRVSREWVLLPAGRATTVTVTVRADNPHADTTIEGLVTVTPLLGGPAIRVPYLLVVRPLVVQTSPDPSDGTSTAYIYSYAPLAQAPTATVRGKTVTATHAYGNWYTASLSGYAPGAYQVSVRATAASGQVLTGTSGFEVTPEEARKIRWEPVGPLSEGGDLALSPSAPQQAVMTQYNKAGPWLTTDAGRNWTQLNRLPVAGGIQLGTVVVDARRSERFWYAVNDAVTGLGKVLRTDDRGKTWRALPVPAGFILTLVADEQTRTLVAVMADGIAVSTDAGDSWTAYPSGVDGEIWYAAMGGADLYLSTSKGVWVRRGVVGEAELVYDAGDGFVYGLVANGTVVAALIPRIGVVGSYDAGRSWSTLLDHPVWGFMLKRSGSDLFMIGTVIGSRVSRDNGRTWSTLQEPLDSAVFTDYDRWADGSITLSAEGAGVYRGSADGSGYQRIGVQGISINALAFSGNTLLAGTSSGLYRATLPIAGPEWGASGGEGYIGVTVSHITVSQGVAWRVQRSAFGSFNVERSTDGGATWETKGTWAEVPIALAVHPADPNRIAVSFWSLGGSGLYSTTNGGSTWKSLYHDTPITAIAGDPSNPDRWWLGDDSGLYRTDDNGVTKTKLADGPVTSVLHTPRGLIVGGKTIRILADGRVRDTDTGNLPLKVSDLVQHGTTLYAATTGYWENGVLKGGRGILRSADGGHTWHNISSSLQNLDTTRLAIGPDGYLYAGTIDGGVHRTRLP